MTITFPITLPTDLVRRVTIRARSTVGLSSSPFTYSQQVFVHPGEMWEADVELRPMRRDEAEVIVSILTALNGREGTLLFGDPANALPRGVATGTPLVVGGGQTGKVLAIDGWTPSTSGILKAGDWLQIGTHLHKVVKDANSDGTGLATPDIWPRLRASPADNDPVIVSGAQGIWRLASNLREWSIGLSRIYDGMTISVIEAL